MKELILCLTLLLVSGCCIMPEPFRSGGAKIEEGYTVAMDEEGDALVLDIDSPDFTSFSISMALKDYTFADGTELAFDDQGRVVSVKLHSVDLSMTKSDGKTYTMIEVRYPEEVLR